MSMSIRRFVGKRRRRARRRLADALGAKGVCRADRAEVERFRKYLSGQMDPAGEAAYEAGQ